VGTVELGRPVSFLALAEGTPVYDRRGERIGVVEQVVGDEALDIFDGVIVHTRPPPGGHLFARVDQISELRERGVLLAVERDALSAPRERRPHADAEKPADGILVALLRRAWDRIGGLGPSVRRAWDRFGRL
jgi:hypothetical protein